MYKPTKKKHQWHVLTLQIRRKKSIWRLCRTPNSNKTPMGSYQESHCCHRWERKLLYQHQYIRVWCPTVGQISMSYHQIVWIMSYSRKPQMEKCKQTTAVPGWDDSSPRQRSVSVDNLNIFFLCLCKASNLIEKKELGSSSSKVQTW